MFVASHAYVIKLQQSTFVHNHLENKYVLYVFIAVQRWILTAHDRAKIMQTCREMTGMNDDASKHHKDASAPRMKKDENDAYDRELGKSFQIKERD